MRVLVTGGAGYIGSQTVRLLQRSGHEPVVLDTLEHGAVEAVDGARLVTGSIADARLVRSLLRETRFDAVVHFAALKAAGESVTAPVRYFDNNVGGTLDLLAEMVGAGVGAVVFSSSCAVYGNPARNPVDETAATHPTTPYGESKVLIERALPWYEREGLRHVSLRYFNAAGAEFDGSHGEDPATSTSLIPLTVNAALHGGQLTINGTDYDTPDGTAVRDYVHVIDLAEAHIQALSWLVEGNRSLTVNLGTGRGWSVLEVIAAAERATGRSISTLRAGRRAGDPAAIWAETQLAAATLGWHARHDLDDILASATAWQAAHPRGYRSPHDQQVSEGDEPA